MAHFRVPVMVMPKFGVIDFQVPEFEIPSFGSSPIISAVIAVAVFIVGVKIIRIFFVDDREPFRDSSRAHNWRNMTLTQGGNYCNVCKKLIMTGEGMYCDCCCIYADAACMDMANQKEPCKAITANPNEPMKHHWVKGNLPPQCICDVCEKDCFGDGLKDYRCCWCLRAVHNSCKPHIAEVCDFGPYKSLIIPPTSVEAVPCSIKKYLVLKSVKPTNWPDWSPLIIITNCKSGNKNGEEMLSLFRSMLHPGQVINLGTKRPEAALEWCIFLGKIQCKILVAGGDGTIGWVLNTIAKAKLQSVPAVAILPLGTGNDLSRVLGWGKGVTHVDPVSVLDNILEAETVLFDRWKVEIKTKRSLRINSSPTDLFMYNYLSIGVDAQVTLDFHKARESPFYIFKSRMFNKLLYLGYGTQQFIEKKCQGLNEKIEIYLDGVKKELPAIESIVILNIDSWGAGVHLWEMSETEENKVRQSYNDKKLEVIALYSSLHIAQLQVGLGTPFRVGQASCIQPLHVLTSNSDNLQRLINLLHQSLTSISYSDGFVKPKYAIHCRVFKKCLAFYRKNSKSLMGEIELKVPIAVQADGEPWLQQPAVFEITHYNQALMLKNTK